MSVNVDDHGAHPHPTGRLTRFGDAAASAGVHSAYLVAIRDGAPGHPYRVPITRDLTVTLTITARGPGRPPYDTTRETESWQQLRAVITDIHASGVTRVLHPGLPEEIATASWVRDGHRVRVARPGAPRRAARSRWNAFTATPIVAALAEKAGQITIGGVTAAAFLVPVPPLTLPPADHGRVQVDRLGLGVGHDHTSPAPLALPEAFAPSMVSPLGPLLPEPRHDTAQDEIPDPSPTPAVTSPVAGPLPAPSPQTSPTVTWSPTPAEPPDTTPPADTSKAPSPTATEEPAPAPSVSAPPPSRRVGPPPDRRHRPGRRHGHRKHGHHHRHRRGR